MGRLCPPDFFCAHKVRYDITGTHQRIFNKKIKQLSPTTMTLDRIPPAKRNSYRISVTIPFTVYSFIVEQSSEQGRSISNLIAYLLERQVDRIRAGKQ